MMFRTYAHFSVSHPYLHKANLLILFAIFALSCYQLLANENIVYAAGFLFVIIPIFIFAKSSDYKRKYLSADK
ncbi:hypothetical protein C9I89_15750 [Photobacterium lipolyticum]|uniref:Uncharacterized protein n=1 Tax=Photobacterium lipolyticum TaxID=266810 RepID=A0A2T3MV57_9GAMM|nr:hypothetical protein C9I89_15750 [Photobacterium lipolyticum]